MLQILNKLRHWWNYQQTPPVRLRRVKNYASQTGFQYQYHLETSAPGDYRFSIWAAGHPTRSLRITVPLPALAARDRYALAKLRLFRTFDEHTPAELPLELEVTDTAALDEL